MPNKTIDHAFVGIVVALLFTLLPRPSCQVDIDECAVYRPCRNNGTCNETTPGEYFCNCNGTEFTGVNCSLPIINDCSISPCLNNATCTNTTEAYNCTCLLGFDGVKCEHEINDCVDQSNLCSLNSTCNWHSDVQNHTCVCNEKGYQGGNCTLDINECSSNPCQNEALCSDYLSFYNCTCLPGYSGVNCEHDIDECIVDQPCLHNSTCNNTPGNYTCNCNSTGYQGANCDSDIDECLRVDLCRNNATCSNTDGSFVCNCTLGYIGSTCHQANCTDIHCQHSARCVVEDDHWKCVDCPVFYSGDLCEIAGACVSSPCYNKAECTQNSTNFHCKCQPEYTGLNCSVEVDECKLYTNATYPCNGGGCTDILGGFTCTCQVGLMGNKCRLRDPCFMDPHSHSVQDKRNHADYCNYQGTCNTTLTEDNLVTSCTCYDGYSGTFCQDTNGISTVALVFIILISVIVALLLIIFLICGIMMMRSRRALQGTYNPNAQEILGSRNVELENVLKAPPVERLI